MLVTVGWQGRKRVNPIVLHVDVVDGQVIIQCNNTEQGIAAELVEVSIPIDAIIRPHLLATKADRISLKMVVA